MILHHLRIALRNLHKHKVYAFITIGGLAVGIACVTCIFLYVQDEISYDTFYHDAPRIYRIVKDFVNADGTSLPDATTPPALLPALTQEIPDIECGARVFSPWGDKLLLSYNDRSFYEKHFLRVDSSFFDVFPITFVRGGPTIAFQQPNSIVISESLAKKYFGSEDPMGKTILYEQSRPLKVTGVVRDIPRQSHFRFDFLLSLHTLRNPYEDNWGWYNFYTYIKVRNGVASSSIASRIQQLFRARQPGNDNIFHVQPLAGIDGIHLKSHLAWELEPNSDTLYIYVFLTIALFVILIAGINYVNLSTAKSALRAKEIGVRKVAGAARSSLVSQFLAESVLSSLVASLVATGLVEMILPSLNAVTQKNLSLFASDTVDIWLLVGGIAFATGVLAGLYPALYLSSFQPVAVLKGWHGSRRKPLNLRQMLVVCQFALSIILITGILVIQQQMYYIQSVHLGFNRDEVLVIENVRIMPDRGTSVQDALAQVPGVEKIASCDGMVGGQNWTTDLRLKGSNNSQLVDFLSVSPEFLDVLGIQLKEGRGFSEQHPPDIPDAIILNETAVKTLGIHEPAVGQQVVWRETKDTVYYATVIGVVRDFHYSSLRNEIKSFAFVNVPARTSAFAIRVSHAAMHETVDRISSTWAGMVKGRPLDFHFLDQSIDNLYRSEKNFRTVFAAMTGLSLVIASSGLFGLSAFSITRRTKEIGIRKVLGASVGAVTGLLSREFIRLVLVANLIAFPVAWYAMNQWLQTFAYRIEMSVWTFIFAGVLALVIALLTVGGQAIRAAIANPVDALRYE